MSGWTPETGFAPAIVCCVEAGGLEDQTIRMVRSLRSNGGRLSEVPVFAVKARRGAPLARATLTALQGLAVSYKDISTTANASREPWNHFMNKPYALAHVGAMGRFSHLIWLDSDVLISEEPLLLIPGEGEDICACPVDSIGATKGPADPMDRFWHTLCQGLGFEMTALPRIRTMADNIEIPLYFNSGVFCFRTSRGFEAAYLATCREILQLGIRSKITGIYFTDQFALGLTIHRTGLRWRALPLACNYPLGSASFANVTDRETLQSAQIVHYHDALWAEHWAEFCDLVLPVLPQLQEVTQAAGPLSAGRSAVRKIAIRVIREVRKWQFRRFEARCRPI